MSFVSKYTQERIKKRAAVVCKKISPDMIPSIISLIDTTRIQLGLSATSFSTLLSITPSSYYRMVESGQTLNALILLRFCALFGYDLEMICCGPITAAVDTQAVELATLIGSLPDSVLQAISQVVDNNSDMSKVDKRLFMEALTEYRQRRKEYIDQLITEDFEAEEAEESEEAEEGEAAKVSEEIEEAEDADD